MAGLDRAHVLLAGIAIVVLLAAIACEDKSPTEPVAPTATPTPTPGPTSAPTSTPTPPPGATLGVLQTSLFTPSCAGCHGSGGDAGLDLRAGRSFSNLVNVAARTQAGTRVIPFNPGQSVLVLKLAAGHRSVSAANQSNVRSWISAGALDN